MKETTFLKQTGTTENREKDYVFTILVTNKQTMNLVPLRPDQVSHFFDTNNNFRSVRAIAKGFERLKEPKDPLVKTWLRAAFVAKDTTNNADSMSQLQTAADMPATFTQEQSDTFYTDIKIGFNESDHLFGTTVANGLLNCLHPSFTPEPDDDPEIKVVDATGNNINDEERQTRPRPAAAATAQDGLLQRLLHMEEQLAVQTRLNIQHQVGSRGTKTSTSSVDSTNTSIQQQHW